MTLVSSIILDAYRETNIIPIGQTLSTDQNAEGLRRIQTIIQSMLGNEAGENLQPMPLGQNQIVNPSGYPWYSNSIPGNIFIPVNTRVMLNLTGPGQINFSPRPDDGARMGIVDVSFNTGTYPLTVVGNGRSIEGYASVVVNTSGTIREWFYRADLGNWVKVSGLTITSDMPFPPEFDDLFITMLAARINPRYGQQLDPQSQTQLMRVRTQFRSRYKQGASAPSENALLFLSNFHKLYGRYSNRTYGNTGDYFNSGYPF